VLELRSKNDTMELLDINAILLYFFHVASYHGLPISGILEEQAIAKKDNRTSGGDKRP
jgi:hypothetical protein